VGPPMNQVTQVLPKSAWDNVVINENNDSIVEMGETDRIKIGLIEKPGVKDFLIRKTVWEKLKEVSYTLPEGTNLSIIEGWRSVENQQASWDRSFNALKVENPSWTDQEIEDKVKLVVARPHPLANHHCGGAVDLTLVYEDGNLIDMGSPYPNIGYGIEVRSKFPMFALNINEEQKNNRKILRDAMVAAGFVWYPGEWWHYCYGDRMWAVYTNKKECFYGPVDLIA